MAFGLKLPKATTGIKPIKLSTSGVHPLVKASMLPRMKASKMSGVQAQSNMLRGMARSKGMQPTSGTKNLMSRVEMKSRRGVVGRMPRA
jgi:hypothetical protein